MLMVSIFFISVDNWEYNSKWSKNLKTNNTMELIKSLEWRYATKKMNGEKIPQDKLERILEATRLARVHMD